MFEDFLDFLGDKWVQVLGVCFFALIFFGPVFLINLLVASV